MNWRDDILLPAIGPLLKAILWSISRTRLPKMDGRMKLKGIKSPLEIMRDHWGVAHIYGSTKEDVLFGQGYVHAQERLWQMDFTRRVVAGRLSEILGESALGVDRAMRTLSLRVAAEKDAQIFSDRLASLLAAYCRGANTFIDSCSRRKKLPVEFMLLGYSPEPWTVVDICSWGKLMSWNLATNWQSELYRRELTRTFGEEKIKNLEIDIDKAWSVILDLGKAIAGNKSTDHTRPFTGPNVDEGVGSNSWVVHGIQTNTGKPLLANDMHLELTTPGVWFENHLAGGGLDVTGITMPGLPLVIVGHNRNVAWGFTDSCPDVQDLYEEHLRQSNGECWEYEYEGAWVPAQIRKEKILVKGGRVVEEDVVLTRHGPVINNLFKDAFPKTPPMSLRWTALEPDHSIEAFLAMNMAVNCLEFKQALRNFDNPSQNVIYADIGGNIGYTMNGRIPIRAKGDGTIPAKGWTGEYEWAGYIPFEELPHLYNPPSAYIVTANNQIQRPDFPHFLGKDYLVSERAGRIVELLKGAKTVDIPFIKKMHTDQVSISSKILAHHLGKLKAADPELQAVIDGMRTWDGSLNADSWQAAVYEVTIRAALSILLEHHFGDLGSRIQGKGPFSGQWSDHVWEWFVHLLENQESVWFDLGNGEKRDDVLLVALREGIDILRKELGQDRGNWKWGDLHRLTFGHVIGKLKPFDKVFNLGPYPIGGDGNTIWASFSSLSDLRNKSIVGPPFRFIADLNDLDHCWGILVPGQSGHLSSKHYKDGITPWFKGEYHPMLFSREEVVKGADTCLRMVPEN